MEVSSDQFLPTLSNERDAPNITISKNVTPQITCDTDVPNTSTTATEPSSHSVTPPLLEKPCQPEQDFTCLEISEAVAWGYSVKKVFLEISQNSQENTCARASF